MPDETPAAKPRPERQRKPEGFRPPKKLTRREAEELEYSTCLVNADQQVCIQLSTFYDREYAALTMGWTLDQVEATLRLPECRNYARKQQQINMDAIARAKIRQLTKVHINPAAVEERAMELAMLDPKETRGTIDGQVKALRLLAETLGMLGGTEDPLRGKSREDLVGIVNAVRAKTGLLPGSLQDSPIPEY